MSRDWTPRQCLAAEQILNGKSWLDVTREMTVTYNGIEKLMCPPDYCDFLEQFNYFKRVGCDVVFPLYEKYGNACFETMQDLEESLARYITTGEIIIPWLSDWFDGELDENFYYADRNNQLFLEHAEVEIESRLRNKAQNIAKEDREQRQEHREQNQLQDTPAKKKGR